MARGGPETPNCGRCIKRLGEGGTGRCPVPPGVRVMWAGPDEDRDHGCAYYSYGTKRKKAVEAPQEALF